MFVSFLIISRVTMSLARYNSARDNLTKMYRESRELIQNACVFTKEDQSQGAKEWRYEVAYHTCLLLRLAMAVVDYPDTKVPSWEIPELQGRAKEYLLATCSTNGISNRWAHASRGLSDDNMRYPIRAVYLLRDSVFSGKRLLEIELQAWQWSRLFGPIDTFMNGYYGMRKFMTAPFPFPLVQMARTFLFVYVYTLPFVLLSDQSLDFSHLVTAFFVTYGLVGLEYVSIEMDDPFGEDANDFDNLAMALTAFEDTYITIYTVDGCEWADKLRYKMRTGPEDSFNPPPEQGWLSGRKHKSILEIDTVGEDVRFFECRSAYTEV
mmetsp:Transcript_25660/g.36197  ORF Transcript_25660/g.36197 Transcript_25660/m.36197 type:complete len:322 (+) Transcript_25660:423-1388(+)